MTRRLTLCRVLMVVWGAFSTAGCGGKTGTLNLSIVVSKALDPFEGATQVRFTLGDSSHVKTVPVTNGHFKLSVDRPPGNQGIVTIDALDAANNILGHGQTPNLSLMAIDQTVAVWVGRPGTLVPALSSFPMGRADLAATYVPGLGVIYAGGRDSSGAILNTSSVYYIFSQTLIPTATLNSARANAVIAPVSGNGAALFGGTGTTNSPIGSLEVFTPLNSNTGSWSPIATTAVDARSHANSTLLKSGQVLISGGVGSNGPLNSAALLSTGSTIDLTTLPTPMVAARVGHAVAAATFANSDGALLFGGLAQGTNASFVAEVLIGQTFMNYPLPADVSNRIGATATELASGLVLIAGGHDASGALRSGFIIDPKQSPAVVTSFPLLLSTARDGHTATRVGNDVLICGGADQNGLVQATCDLLDGTTLGIKRSLNLNLPRRDHTAFALETGPIVLAGGVDQNQVPISAIDIYTPEIVGP